MTNIHALTHQRSRYPGMVDTRTIGWIPTTVLNCMAWYEARKETYTDGQTGAYFHDWSGNDYHLSGGGAGTFHTNGGKPYIDTTNGNYTYGFPARGANPTTLIIAATNGGGGTITMGLGSNRYLAFGRNTLFTWGWDPGYNDIGIGPMVMICTFSGSQIRLYKANELWAWWDNGFSIASGICLLNWLNYDRPCGGRAYAAAVWDKVLTEDERASALNYFSLLY